LYGHHGSARRTNSGADDGCTDSSTSADSGTAADGSSHARACSKLLQVGKQLRRKLCNWVVHPEQVSLRWLQRVLVRPDTTRHCEAARGKFVWGID